MNTLTPELQKAFEDMEEVFKDQFMKPEISLEKWVIVDGQGACPYEYLNDAVNDGQEYEVVTGYGARLSASGYLDCTDWTVHDTIKEAIDSLIEMYAE